MGLWKGRACYNHAACRYRLFTCRRGALFSFIGHVRYRMIYRRGMMQTILWPYRCAVTPPTCCVPPFRAYRANTHAAPTRRPQHYWQTQHAPPHIPAPHLPRSTARAHPRKFYTTSVRGAACRFTRYPVTTHTSLCRCAHCSQHHTPWRLVHYA